jgi:septal ring factor EnvC (AmiA/AmiB activator)
LDAARQRLADESAHLQQHHEELTARAAEQHTAWTLAQSLLAELRSQLALEQSELATFRQKLSGAAERAAVLEEPVPRPARGRRC